MFKKKEAHLINAKYHKKLIGKMMVSLTVLALCLPLISIGKEPFQIMHFKNEMNEFASITYGAEDYWIDEVNEILSENFDEYGYPKKRAYYSWPSGMSMFNYYVELAKRLEKLEEMPQSWKYEKFLNVAEEIKSASLDLHGVLDEDEQMVTQSSYYVKADNVKQEWSELVRKMEQLLIEYGIIV